MKDLLVVLNPREIKECIDAIRAMPMAKLWLRRLHEVEIVKIWPFVLSMAETHGYERLWLISDDAVPRPYHVDLLSFLVDQGHPVVTGYSNLAENDMRVNLTKTPLGPRAIPEAYDFYHMNEIQAWPTIEVPTTVAGFSLTVMSREMWTRFPFMVEEATQRQSDYNLSMRLAAAGVPIVAHRDVLIWHLKKKWGALDEEPRKRLLIGVEPAEVKLEE